MKLQLTSLFWVVMFLVGTSQLCLAQNLPTESSDKLINQYLEKNQTQLKRSNAFQVKVQDELVNKTTNIRYIYGQQQYQGIDVEDAMLTLAYSANGKHTSTDALVNAKVNTITPTLSAEQGVRAAMMASDDFSAVSTLGLNSQRNNTEQYTVFDKGEIASHDIITRLMYVKSYPQATEYRLAWETQLYTLDRQHYWVVYTDATHGKVLKKRDLVLHCSFGESMAYDASPEEQKIIDDHKREHAIAHAKEVEKYLAAHQEISLPTSEKNFMNSTMMTERTYRVVPVPAASPIDGTVSGGFANDRGLVADFTPGTQTDVTTAGDPIASPLGWTSIATGAEFPYTRGNNVWSFYDPSPGPLGGVPSEATSATESPTGSGNYLYDWDLTAEPNLANGGTLDNQNSAIVSLFYMNNMMHDVFYGFGFTEENRNFQNNNMMKGGLGNDEVLAQAQDGGGTNNANMLTLRDGVNGQMQMYLWTPAVLEDIVHIDPNLTTGDVDFNDGEIYQGKPGSFPSASNKQDLTDPANWVTAELILINDPADGCTNDPNNEGCGNGNGVGVQSCNDITGKIVVLRRGECSFVEKVRGADESGAAGVIVVNNVDSPPAGMGGSDATTYTIDIPSVMIFKDKGEKLISAMNVAASPIVATLKLETDAAPLRDGDFDNTVIGHEYGHGISSRTSPQTATGGSLSGDEQGGEGWSDFWGLYMTLTSNDLDPATGAHPNGVLPSRGIGNYVTYQSFDGPGIRPQPYSIDMSINSATYNTIANDVIAAPHGVGFVWCTMLYELMQKMIDRYGFNDDLYIAPKNVAEISSLNAGGNNVANILVLEGIRNQTQSPTFTAQRDAILKADELMFGGAHQCDIWEAFAKRGCGFSAESGSNAKGDQEEAFDMPFDCDPTGTALLSVSTTLPDMAVNAEEFTYTVTVTSEFDIAVAGVILEQELPADFIFVSSNFGGTQSVNTITIPVGVVGANSSVDVQVTVSVATSTATGVNFYDVINNANEWDVTSNTEPVSSTDQRWLVSDALAFSGNSAWYVVDPDNFSDQMLDLKTGRVTNIEPNSELVFYHNYATELAFDGGKVFISTDNGASFTDLGDRMTEQGYNDNIPPENANPAFPSGGETFGGGSGGYVRTHVDLSDFAGDDAIFRFRFGADVGTGAGGWAVDNVLVGTTPTFRQICSTVTGINANGDDDCATTLITPGTGLAVELLDLKAVAQKDAIQLDWTTLTETENKGFSIERRAEGETDFTAIDFVTGRGNSQQMNNYTYTDHTAKYNTVYYYRLQAEEMSGATKQSNIVSAQIIKAGKEEYDVELVPNPTSSIFSLTWTKDLPKAYEVNVTTVSGQLLYSQKVADGAERLFLNLDLPANIYVVRILMEDKVITKKLVVN